LVRNSSAAEVGRVKREGGGVSLGDMAFQDWAEMQLVTAREMS
jgi:hypothetical protein